MKICPNCVFYQIGKININGPDIPHKCSKGNTEEFNNWWKDNGKKNSKSSDLTQMECFEDTQLGKFLNKSHEILDELKRLNENK